MLLKKGILLISATIDNPNVNACSVITRRRKTQSKLYIAFVMKYCSISLLAYQWQALSGGWFIPSGLKSKASYI